MEPGVGRDGELTALVREPAGEPEGALVLLHGRGTGEQDLHPLLDALDPGRRLLGITPGGPLTGLPPSGRHWYAIEQVGQPHEETFVETMTQLSAFLDALLRERGIPWDHTVVGGFSQGGAVSLALALGTGRPRAAGILAMSCFLPTVRGWRIDVRAKRGMHAYVSHGTYDNIIPVGFGRRVRDLLEEGGLEVEFRESRVQHQIDPELLPEMQAWLAARTSGANAEG
ncbi:MAG: phospholipase [Actinobacteria bacterium]|nr:phospholipase [Actinomycetota bacterium]